jgi:hypothetical protein
MPPRAAAKKKEISNSDTSSTTTTTKRSNNKQDVANIGSGGGGGGGGGGGVGGSGASSLTSGDGGDGDVDLLVLVFHRLSLLDAPLVCVVSKLWNQLFWASRLRLRFDELGDKTRIVDQRLPWLASKCPHLQFLDLTAAPFITDIGLALIAAHMPTLRRLALSALCNFSDDAVKRLATMPLLVTLQIQSGQL